MHWPTIFSVAIFPFIVLAYYLLARSEERKVLAQFGDEYRAYQQRVPMSIPCLGERGWLPDGSSSKSAMKGNGRIGPLPMVFDAHRQFNFFNEGVANGLVI